MNTNSSQELLTGFPELDVGPETVYSGAKLLEQSRVIFGIDFVTGLPCGELQQFIAASAADSELQHCPATNEGEAVGIATGAWLGGKTPALYMQNSGLFKASNDIGSLMIPSKIPALFVVSWRGAIGETATQHLATGRTTRPLLSGLGIEHTTRPKHQSLETLSGQQKVTQLPIAVLQTREAFNTPTPREDDVAVERYTTEMYQEKGEQELSSREVMLDVLAQDMPDSAAVITSTGLISRSQYQNHDGKNQFYNAGGFGLTSSIGLGVTLAQPDRRVVVIEGDGSVLTDTGNLNLIGHYQPDNLIHVVLNNRAYVSCSGESTIGTDLIPELAQTFGYKRVVSVISEQAASEAIADMLSRHDGPQMLHISINTEGERSFVRPVGMAEIAKRFHNFLETK